MTEKQHSLPSFVGDLRGRAVTTSKPEEQISEHNVHTTFDHPLLVSLQRRLCHFPKPAGTDAT